MIIIISSFNVEGARPNWHALRHLLQHGGIDILAVQEHWLAPAQLHFLEDLASSCGFLCICSSAMTERVAAGLVRGRGHGGVAVLCRASTCTGVSRVTVDSDRLIAVQVEVAGRELLAVSVYLPWGSNRDAEAVANYLECLARLRELSAVADSSGRELVVMGDFNMDFGRQDRLADDVCDWVDSCGLEMVDVLSMDADTVTFRNNNGAQAWLDHCAVPVGFGGSSRKCSTLLPPGSRSMHLALLFHCHLAQGRGRVPSSRRRVNGPRAAAPLPRWNAVSGEHLRLYRAAVTSLNTPLLQHGAYIPEVLDTWTANLINGITEAAARTLPQKRSESGGGRCAGWWTDALEDLKQRCIFWRWLWVQGGRPAAGQLHLVYRSAKARYKAATRTALRSWEEEKWAVVAEARCTGRFWAKVQALRGGGRRSRADRVGDETTDAGIARLFADRFETACSPWDHAAAEATSVELLERRRALAAVPPRSVTPDEVREVIITRLKAGKSPDIHGLSGEHLLHVSDVLAAPLASLFTAMLHSTYLPTSLRRSVFFAVPKDPRCGLRNPDNYRGIAVAPVIFRVLEGVLARRNDAPLSSDRQQHAYKVGGSCATCATDLLDTVEYYRTRGSQVHLLFLDASKAFDKVLHPLLTSKLLERGVPASEALLLHHSLQVATGSVRYGGAVSRCFGATAGVRQGSLLGGTLWAIYIDLLLQLLRDSGYGCQMDEEFRGAFSYADDTVLVASSVHGLRQMIRIVETYCLSHQIALNPQKSVLMSSALQPPRILLGGGVVALATEVKYLGYKLCWTPRRSLRVAGKLSVGRFFSAANAILGIPACNNRLLRVRLLRVFAVPHIDLLLRVWRYVPRRDRGVVSVAWNKLWRRALGLHSRCSTDLVCSVAGVTPISIRAGQLQVLQARDALADDRTDRVLLLRHNGLHAASAAATVFFGLDFG